MRTLCTYSRLLREQDRPGKPKREDTRNRTLLRYKPEGDWDIGRAADLDTHTCSPEDSAPEGRRSLAAMGHIRIRKCIGSANNPGYKSSARRAFDWRKR